MNKREFKRALVSATMCNVQHDGWPCGTCFFTLPGKITNKDWQSVLLFRGDYKKEDLDNLPKNPQKAIEKIYNICKNMSKLLLREVRGDKKEGKG